MWQSPSLKSSTTYIINCVEAIVAIPWGQTKIRERETQKKTSYPFCGPCTVLCPRTTRTGFLVTYDCWLSYKYIRLWRIGNISPAGMHCGDAQRSGRKFEEALRTSLVPESISWSVIPRVNQHTSFPRWWESVRPPGLVGIQSHICIIKWLYYLYQYMCYLTRST